MRSAVLCAILLLVTSPAIASDQAASRYKLSVSLRDGDLLVGEPKLEILADKAARIEIQKVTGDAYSLDVTATTIDASTVRLASVIDIVSPSGTRRSAHPTLSVQVGKTATIVFGEESKDAQPIRVDLMVEALPAS